MTSDIVVTKINESKMQVHTKPNIHGELSGYFSARPVGFQYMPRYQAGIWDGFIRFYSYGVLRTGLLEHLKKFAIGGEYSIDIQFEDKLDIQYDDFLEFVDLLEISEDKFEKRDYQLKAAHSILCNKRECCELTTAGGKSLIMYLVTRFITLTNENAKMLIVVPRTSLVEQLYKDYREYGWDSIGAQVHRIYSGKEKSIKKQVTISTWQSVFREKEIFAEFDAFLIDESHHAKSKSILHITDNCINAQWRVGTSGTYPDPKTADWLATVGGIGPIISFIKFKELKERNWVADAKINNLILRYSDVITRQNYEWNQRDYFGEVDFINDLNERTEFIAKMATNLNKNTFILFTRIAHGKTIFERIKRTNKRVFYIDGSTKVDKREEIRDNLERNNNVVLVASFGTFAEGVNIKNIHNIIFAANYKSKIKVLQAIGRGLRLLEGKTEVVVYDLIDDLSWEDHENYTLRHFAERKRIYKKQGFDNIETFNINIK